MNREARTNSNEEDNEAHAGNPCENFQRQTNQAAVIRVQGSMTKAIAKRLQDGWNAYLQARFSVFNIGLELQELFRHPRS